MTKTADEVMAVAKSYLGTKENPPGSNNVIFNTDYYGHAVSGADYPWCCVFVWDVFRLAGASELFYDGQKTAYCPTYENWAIERGLTVMKDVGQYGDVATMDFGKGRASHIGFILARLTDGTYQTIEGNTSVTSDDNGGAVMVRVRSQKEIRYIFRSRYGKVKNYLSKGDTGDGVKRLQEMLMLLGYSVGSSGADGSFGNATEIAVLLFQKDHGLTADGIVGEQTSQMLEEVVSNMGAKMIYPKFTAEQIVTGSGKTYKMAHNGGWIYADSMSLPPCADKRISCDRLEARTLWDLGMTAQRKGGEVCGTFPDWFEYYGFQKITDKARLKGGDMVFVDNGGMTPKPDSTWHMFTLVDYNPKTGMCHKYDMGSNARIRGNQPFYTQLEEWGEKKRFKFAYRVPYVKGVIDGEYVIESAVDRSFCIDADKNTTNVQIWREAPNAQQRFYLQHIANGFYRIILLKNGKVIDLSGAKAVNRRNIQQYAWNGTKAQLWKPEKNADGTYTFVSAVNSGYVLDLRGAKAVNGQNIYLYKRNDTKAQKWYLVKK